MENASKALLMAAGVLVGVLLLTLIATLFLSSKDLLTGYEQTKQSEAVQQFNVNFTKHIGKDLTIHQVITICNFAKENGFEDKDIKGIKTINDISSDDNQYKLKIVSYSEEGYVNAIEFKVK